MRVKRLLSLFIVLAVMLTTVGTMEMVAVSAEETVKAPVKYTEDFENITFNEDGSVSTASANPLATITIPS